MLQKNKIEKLGEFYRIYTTILVQIYDKNETKKGILNSIKYNIIYKQYLYHI